MSKLALGRKIDAYIAGKAPASPLIGTGDAFCRAGWKRGVDPRLIVAIAGHETRFGTYRPCQSIHNPFGLGPGIEYRSWRESIRDCARRLRLYYLARGLTTIEEIGAKWAPVGIASDPRGLNSHWVPGVTAIYRELGGTRHL